MEVLFWICLASLLWAYAGYPATMLTRAAMVPRRAERRPAGLPTVTAVLAVRNPGDHLLDRVQNLLDQDYPRHLLNVVVVCNGSSKETVELANALASSNARVDCLVSPAGEGKAGALNMGAAHSTADVLVFADVRQRFDPKAVRWLVRAFRDSGTGAVTGRLVIGRASSTVVAGVGRYWELETRLRMAESRTGSVVGVTGAIYAARCALFPRIPAETILDDVYVPLHIVRQGYRIAMAPRAIAYDTASVDGRAEYRRRVRTLLGNLELVRLMPWLIVPGVNPIFGRYVSHKLLRVLTPALCIGLLVSGTVLPGIGYQGLAASLAAAYVLGAVGLITPVRLLALPSAFLLLHTAGFSALLRPWRRASDVWAG
ncbi:MAG TPA: glycosyltransferase [Longimicrobiales bacterium]|nr:glycosyltransferase [Longimicrobiales bacterium]